jgi:hypothetical protein
MSKQDEHDVLGELESVIKDAFSGIKGEWQELQMRLLRESRQMTDEFLAENTEVKAMLCVGTIISEGQFSDPDDGIQVVGPDISEYQGVGSGDPVHARMSPAVGVGSAGDMYKFLSDKSLVCSLYEATDYVTLFMHAKFKNSALIAMSSPNGIAVTLERKDKPDHSFYLMFDDETKETIKGTIGTLSDKQKHLLMELCEAQIVAPQFKKTQPKIWDMMIETIKEYHPNGFLNPTEGDE